jgi:hypothetical protein
MRKRVLTTDSMKAYVSGNADDHKVTMAAIWLPVSVNPYVKRSEKFCKTEGFGEVIGETERRNRPFRGGWVKVQEESWESFSHSFSSPLAFV